MADGMMNRRQFVGAAAQRLVIAVICLMSSAVCCAEELNDPTRPPASISAPVAQSDVAAAGKTASLQSIITGKHRRAAIIDGLTVELGGKLGDAKLVEVNDTNVVLRKAQGRQVLTLFPEVKMTSVKAEMPPTSVRINKTARPRGNK